MSKEDIKWRLRDSKGNEYIIIDSEKVDMQEELNKTITKQMKEIERLHSIIKEVREDMKEVRERYNYYGGNFDLSILSFWIEKLETLDKVDRGDSK